MNNEQHLLDEYIEAHTTNDDAVLAELYRTTHLHVMNPRMASGPVQGQFLQFIVQMLKPKRILEIGTFTGYSSICLAKALPEGGLLTTIEAGGYSPAIDNGRLPRVRSYTLGMTVNF